MSLNIRLMNLFIGMCKGVAGVPRDFRRLNYLDKWVELSFANSQQEVVNPELVIASRTLGHTALFEWKAGANTDADQLRRYAAVTDADLVGRAGLGADEAQTHDVVLIGTDEFRERIVIAIDRDGHGFPVLIVTDDGLEKIRNRFVPPDLDNVFQPRLAVDWDTVPTNFFPLDTDSEVWEFAELMIPEVLHLMARGEPRILPRQLEEAVIPCWRVFSPAYQGQMRQKMNQVMRLACERDFRPYLRVNRERAARQRLGRHWDVIDNPLSGVSDRRQRDWKDMMRRQRRFLEFLKTGRDFPEQLALEEA